MALPLGFTAIRGLNTGALPVESGVAAPQPVAVVNVFCSTAVPVDQTAVATPALEMPASTAVTFGQNSVLDVSPQALVVVSTVAAPKPPAIVPMLASAGDVPD